MRRTNAGIAQMTVERSKWALFRSAVKDRLLPLSNAYPLLTIIALFLSGLVAWGGFNWSLEMTNTEQFCISCHVMRDHPFKEYKSTIHYANRSGVRATCPDCHVPREWIHKVVRKVRATNELYHWLKGSIDTDRKFDVKRGTLAAHVWQSMKATDSRECRNCHDNASMRLDRQSDKGRMMHALGSDWKMTCIDCHKGIAHSLPRNYDKNAFFDQLHERFKVQKIECHQCHTDMAGSKKNDGWDD